MQKRLKYPTPFYLPTRQKIKPVPQGGWGFSQEGIMGFTKLDSGILRSSIMAEDSDTFKVWIALLACCGQDGIADVSPLYLASVCHMDIDTVRRALNKLEMPDTDSRSTNDEGRRIRRVDGGYEIINYFKYREKSYHETEAERARKRRERNKNSDTSGHVRTNSDMYASASASSSEDKERVTEREKEAPPDEKDDNVSFNRWTNEIMTKWNQFAKSHGLAEIKGVIKGSKRERNLRARFKEPGFDIEKIMEKISKSEFLLGLKTDWKVSFDWIICPSNYLKILEGNYDQGETKIEKLKKEFLQKFTSSDEGKK